MEAPIADEEEALAEIPEQAERDSDDEHGVDGWPKASVMIVKWMRVARTHQAPARAAVAVAVATPARRYTSNDWTSAMLKRNAPAYAPSPK